MLDENFRSFCVVTVIMLLWIEVVRISAKLLSIPSWIQRKMLHIFTGPIFILTWPLFSSNYIGSRYAALVPAVMTLKFFLVGIGIWKDDDMIRMSSRTGRREELLYGPLLYGIIFIISTVVFWKSVSGVVYLFILCFGDGMAEIAGRNFGHNNRLFWSPRKSWAGFFGFLFAAYLATYLFVAVYGKVLFNSNPKQLEAMSHFPMRLFWDVVVAGVVETIPVENIDNVTVFASVALFDYFKNKSI